MLNLKSSHPLAAALLAACSMSAPAADPDCAGTKVSGVKGWQPGWKLSDGGFAGFAKMNINIDGYARAYHPRNAEAGALIHLCNAGRIFLPDGSAYEGSESNATCTGKFMADVERIKASGWMDATVGVAQWYGVLGEGSAKIGGRTISSVRPVQQSDGSGFYVSPTSLADKAVSDPKVQARYINPLRIPSAVMPRSLAAQGIALGSFGVAIDVNRRVAVPFVVGDGGPRVGEGSTALARRVAGLAITDNVTRKNRFEGQVSDRDVLWVYFGGKAERFDSKNEGTIVEAANTAFVSWGGEPRLFKCLRAVPRN